MTVSPFRLLAAMATFALLPPPTGLACVQEPHAALTVPGIAAAVAAPALPGGGRLNLTFDLSPAADLLALFRRHSAAPDEIASLVVRPEVRALIAQTARFDPGATAAAFGSSLQRAVQVPGRSDGPDPFAFNRVRGHTADIQRLYDLLSSHSATLQHDIAERLQPDLPAGLDLNVRAVFVLGGTSDGWAQPDQVLYLALQSFDGDYDGLVTLMAHEVYHVVQYSVMPMTGSAAADARQRNAENLMLATLMEGTASFVGDPMRVAGGGSYLEWYRGRYRRNLERIQEDFALFDSLMFRAAHDGEADYGDLYSLGFSGSWGSPLYFVGYRMSQVIARYGGRNKLASYLAQPPGSFFADYMAACDAHPEDGQCVKFDAPTTRTLLQVRDRTVTAGSNRARLFLL